MAYDPKTGEWKPEDESVSGRITGLVSEQSPLRKQADTVVAQGYNRRGLLNSSQRVQAGANAAYAAALPIASQEATQAHNTNIQSRGLLAADLQQGRDITSREKMQTQDITSRESMQDKDIGLQTQLQTRDITSREGMQDKDLSAQKDMQGRDITSREGMQSKDIGYQIGRDNAQITAQKDQTAAQIAAQKDQTSAQIAAQKDRDTAQIASQQWMQLLDLNARKEIGNLDRAAQERIAGMQDRMSGLQLAASDRQNAASMALGFEQAYASQVASIMANPEIPAEARQAYLNSVALTRDSNLALVEQMYGIQLDWGGTNPPTAPPSPAPTPTQTPTPTPASGPNFSTEQWMQVYTAARTANLTAAQVAAGYGLTVQQVNDWVTSRGLPALSGASNTPTPAPAPTPTPVPAPVPTPAPTPTPTPNTTQNALDGFYSALSAAAPALRGTGGQGAAAQAISTLVSQGKAAGLSVDQIAGAAATYFPGTAYGDVRNFVASYY
jgi:hypothetical protein